jgi:hypothetical protein
VPTEEIIVLASSRKLGGRCIAGISTASGDWVRPVSNLQNGQLEKYHCEVRGRWPRPRDIVSFTYEKELDDPAQPENVLIDDEESWQMESVLDLDDTFATLQPHLLDGPLLLGNKGKAVREHIAAEGVDASLAIIEPAERPEFILRPAAETYGKLKPRVDFRWGGRSYELGLTDYVVAPQVLEAGCGRYDAEELGFESTAHTLITISLAEPQNGWHSKLAAAVIFAP